VLLPLPSVALSRGYPPPLDPVTWSPRHVVKPLPHLPRSHPLDAQGGGGAPIILTDILGSEDALGTMDFKVAGDALPHMTLRWLCPSL